MRRLAVAMLMLAAIWWPVLPSSAGQSLAPGISFHTWRQPGSTAHIYGVELEPAAIGRLHVVSANRAAAAGGQTVSQICNGCLAAVNGDFFAGGQALGGVISDGKLLQTPSAVHDQLLFNPPRTVPASSTDGWTATVSGARGTLHLDAVNRPGSGNQLVLFTPGYGPATPACTCAQLILNTDPHLNGRVGVVIPAHAVGYTRQPVALWPSRMVLAGYGAMGQVMARWWQAGLPVGLRLAVRLAAPSAQSVGGHPILIQNGQPWPYDPTQRFRDPFLYKPEPRSAVAWDRSGRLWLVTADGRQGSRGPGLTAAGLIVFLQQQLHAVGAFQLDGGGSATMVVNGQLVNRPSDGWERPVANALVVAALPRPASSRPAAVSPRPAHRRASAPPHRPARVVLHHDALPLVPVQPRRTTLPAATPPPSRAPMGWSLWPWLAVSTVCTRRVWWYALRR